MASSRFQLISKKLVKPSLSTPPSLRNYKLSLIDQLISDEYMPIAFFYPNDQHHKHPHNARQISSLLQESLSKTLSFYYPLAGRLTNSISVNCNDMGATFLEARFRCQMSEILKGENVDAQDIVFPSGLPWSSRRDEQSLVVAQLSHFDCGGKALSICMYHKLGDGNTLCNFTNDWATVARQPSQNPSPQFIGASIFPPIDDPSIIPLPDLKPEKHFITRRYVFDPEKLSQLKAKATVESGVEKPTRFEVVAALLYRCAMSASMVYSGSFRPSSLAIAVNLRTLTGVLAGRSHAGNFLSPCFLPITEERQINFPRLVSEIRRIKVEKYEKYKTIQRDDLISALFEDIEQSKEFLSKDDIQKYNCSSICGFPTCNIDFGWGRPVKVNLAGNHKFGNTFHLMDNQVGGVEASITLEEQVMSLFQSESELLTFASDLSSSF